MNNGGGAIGSSPTNSSVEREEFKNVLNLLKLKNEKPEELSRDQKFLTAAFGFLEKHSECVWCQYTSICGELLRLFSFVESPPLKWFREKTMNCLISCRACIEAYYGVRPKIFSSFRKIYDEATVKDFEGKIHLFDVKRLKEPFEIYLSDKEKRKKLPIKFILFEILLFPGWIISPEVSKLFETVLEQIISGMKMVKISEKLPGVIVCSVHPNQVIRNWAKSVLNTDIQVENEAVYNRINYSWDTIIFLLKNLDDEAYSDAIYVCLKASKFEFIKSGSNWDWTGRIFGLLKKENSVEFMGALRIYSLLMKIISSEKAFQWYKITESFNSISYILDNPAFAQGSHTDQDCANFVLEWIPLTIQANLSEKKFKIAHKIVSDFMEFVVESLAPFQWKVAVAIKFSDSLSSNVSSAYLLSKIGQLLIYLFDNRFSKFRTLEHENLIIKCLESVLISLCRADLFKEIGIEEREMEGTPSSAVFDVSNYRKFFPTIEIRQAVSINLLNSISKEVSGLAIKSETSNYSKIWGKRTDLLAFIVGGSIDKYEIHRFSEDLVTVLIFVYLSGFKLNLSQSVNQQDFLLKIVQNHPEKSLKALTAILLNLLHHKFKMREGAVIPLEKLLYFLNSIIGKVFEKDLEILKIYSEALELVFNFFLKVLFSFFVEFNAFVSLPGGSVYYDLSTAVSSFGITLISMIGTENFEKMSVKFLKSSEITSLLLPCLANLLMHILQRSTQSKYTDIPSLVNLSTEFIIISGHVKADFETARVDQIIKVLLTSNVSSAYKASISSALQQYCRLSGRKLVVPSGAPKSVNIPPVATSSKIDPSLARKLEALEKMDDAFINKHISANNNSGGLRPPSTKLGQLRQEMVREGTNIASSSNPAKKSRFTPIVVQKAPRMMTQADLLRAHADSSDSEADIEITSDTFKNAPHKSTSTPFTAQPHRSVKLINIDDENSGQIGTSSGKPISSKASISVQIQRDWQSAQRLHKYILSLDYAALNDFAVVDVSVQSIPDSFPNYEKYLQVFEPLLQLECRSQIIQSKDETEGRLSYFKGVIQTISMVDDFHEVVFNFGDDAVHRLFTEQDLLVGHPISHNHKKAPSEILGLVIQTSSRQIGFEVTIRFYMKGRSGDVEFQLLTRLKQGWKFAKLCNLVTNNREFLALQNLPLYSSCARILQPKFVKIDSHMRLQIERAAEFYTKAFGLNLPQASAIAYALMNPNFFTLIQGPPGTGKTRTIEGFLAVLFGRPSPEFRVPMNYKRIMICAPSNAAIDEIVRRLKGGVKDSYGKIVPLKIVRVGSIDMIHEDVKDLSIDGIVESMIQGHISSALEMLQTNRKHMADIKTLLDKAQAGDDSSDEGDNEKEKAYLGPTTETTNRTANFNGKSIQELKNQLWQVKENIRKGNKFIEDSRQNLRLKVLNEAQVVCCTLSASGHDVISRIDGDFEMVIIDEACQAIELSALIPLQYGCKRTVLVGDPNQLPPTVISQMAVTFAYEQSLFQRLQKIDPSAVQLLSLQYRMHPDISAFPSSYFYGGKLANGPNVMIENTRPWHGTFNNLLGPFRFLDVPGQEQLRTFSSGKQGNSMMNELEAKITTSLIALISNSSPDYKVNKI